MMNKFNGENVEDILPLTPMQEVMLFNYLSEPGAKRYNEQARYRLSGSIDPGLLKKAFDFVIQSNEMLRTFYRWQCLRKPVQVILKQYRCPMTEYDFSNETAQEAERRVDAIEKKDREAGIDIGVCPLRMILCHLGQGTYDLIITNHHIIYDGWSNGILLRELREAYLNLQSGREPQRPIKNRYQQFIKWLGRQDKDRQKKFWQRYLEGFQSKTVIPYKSNKLEDNAGEKYYERPLSLEEIQGLKQCAKNNQLTLAAMIYGAWAILLHKYTGCRDIVFGVTISGRTAEIQGIESMVGLFINTLPLRIQVAPEEEVAGFIENVGKNLRMIEEYEASLLSDIRSWSMPNRRESIFDVVLVLQNYPLDKELIAGNEIFNIKLHSRAYMTGMPMTLGIRVMDGLILDVTFNAGLYDEDYIKVMAERYLRIIRQMTGLAASQDSSGLRIIEMEIMNISEKQGVLDKIGRDIEALNQVAEVDFDEIF